MATYKTPEDLARAFAAQEQARVGRVARAPTDAAQAGAELVRAATPVDTGALRASIHVERTAVGAEIVADAPHAAAVELGTRHHPPRPFVRQSLPQLVRDLGALVAARVRDP